MSYGIHTAAKEYVCDLCGRKIPQGHRYWRRFNRNEEGDPVTDIKEHVNCEDYSAESARGQRIIAGCLLALAAGLSFGRDCFL